MDGLSPHIEHRVANLHREAEIRRLAASAPTAASPKPRPRSRRALAIAAASLALALAGAPAAYLVAAASAGPSVPVEAVSAPVVEDAGPAPAPLERPSNPPVSPGGGKLVHR